VDARSMAVGSRRVEHAGVEVRQIDIGMDFDSVAKLAPCWVRRRGGFLTTPPA